MEIPEVKRPIGVIDWDKLDPNTEDIWQAKLDGAFLYLTLDKDKGIRAFSYRRSKRDGKPIEHTNKLYGLNKASVPDELDGAILEGEAWHPDLASREVGGILNTRKQELPESLFVALHGINSMPNKEDIGPQESIKLLRKIQKELPIFDMPDTAITPDQKTALKKSIESGNHPQTKEGIIVIPPEGKIVKSVLEPTHDVEVFGTTLGEGKYKDTGIGAILVGNPENPTRVGSGLSDKLRSVLKDNPDLVNGLIARVKAKDIFPSGKLRAPVLQDFHPEKSDPNTLNKLTELIKSAVAKKKKKPASYIRMFLKEAVIKQENGKYKLYTRDGSRILGTHESYEDALRQERVIQMRKHAQEEFAPGIPLHRNIEDIPEFVDSEWEYSLQSHDADRAGMHYDLRLADPDTQFAHSWALPKHTLPNDNSRVRLAVQQPTHTMSYMNFEGDINEGYGKGSVKLEERGKVKVKTSPGKVEFEHPQHGPMAIIQKDGKQWIIVKKKNVKTAAEIIRASLINKIAEFKVQTDPKLKTRVSPFRKDMTSKAETPYEIKAPDITTLSTGKSDRGKIE